MLTNPTSEPARPPSSVLVMGCHRSGTSAVARALNLMGLALPERLMGAGRGNVLGHWEPAAISRFNERLLETLERSWFDPKPLPGAWLEQLGAYRAEAAALWEAERRPGLTTVFKDPRFSRLAQFWHSVLPDAPLAVLVCRNPHDVAASLNRRDGFDSRHGFLLWETYMLEAEAATRGLKRILVHYAELIGNPRGVLDRLAGFAGIGGDSGGAASSIDAGQSHHGESLDRFFENPKVPEPVKESYRALLMPDALNSSACFDRLKAQSEERWRKLSPGGGPSPQALKRPETFFGRSLRAAARNDLVGALADARKAAKLAPQDPLYHVQTGKILAMSGATGEALDAFRHASALDDRDSLARHHLITALRTAGRASEALAEARKAVRQFPVEAPMLLLSAHAMIDGAAPEEAVLAIVRALGLSGPAPEVLLLLALALCEAGHAAAAAGHAREALRLAADRQRHDLRFQAGWMLYKCGDPEAAETVFRDLAGQPDHAAAAFAALASLLQRGGRHGEARTAALQALRLDPDRGDAAAILRSLS